MATTNETVNIWVKVQGGAAKALTGINKQLKKNDKQVKSNALSWKKLAAGVGAMAVLNKVNQWSKESVRLAKQQEVAERKLTASLGYRSKALLEYASALQQKTIYGDEETIASAALVANFIKEEDQIKRIIRVSQDLATAKGMSLSSATDLVTKSVSSSMNAMSRYSIVVEGAAGSVERIDSAVNALDKAFGGMSEAVAQGSGKLEQMDNQIGDIREEVGEKLMPAVVKVKEATLLFYTALGDENGVLPKTIDYLAQLSKETATVVEWYSGGAKRFNDNAKATHGYQVELERLTKIVEKHQKVVDDGGGGLFGKTKQALAEKDLAHWKSVLLAHRQNKIAHDENLKIAQKKADEDAVQAEKDKLAAEEAARVAAWKARKKFEESSARVLAQLNYDATQEAKAHYIASNEAKIASADKTENYLFRMAQEAQEKGDKYRAKEADAQAVADADAKEKMQARMQGAVAIAEMTGDAIKNVIGAVQNKRQQEYDNEVTRQKEEVKNSSLSAKQKAAANAKIDAEAAKKRHELRLKEWRASVVTSIVDTQLAGAKTMATMGYPAGIPFAIAAQVAGAIATGTIIANKPKMYNGGKLTNKTGMQGDVVPFVGRVNEEVVTPEEKKRMSGGTTVHIGAPSVVIQGNADAGTAEIFKQELNKHARTIEKMFTSRAINPNKINGALSV